jgi:glycosyltransferase involved in cell wall biosynthesis
MRVLFVHNALRSFVRVDRDILASEHTVDELDLSVRRRLLSLPWRLARAEMVYAWFAGLHSLFPVLLARAMRKPAIVVVGGYDTANLPEIGYGHMAHPVKRHIVRLICNSATALIVNSQAAAREVAVNVGTSTPVHMLYHGFEAPAGSIQLDRESLVISAGNVSAESMQRKGHLAFAAAARLVPEARFVLVGEWQDTAVARLRGSAPENLDLPGFLPQTEFDDLLARASVYVQASAHEGFGCAVAEAMAAGCIPVVTESGALPEVVGDAVIQIGSQDPAELAAAIRAGLSAVPECRIAAQKRIEHMFSLTRRRKALLSLVTSLARGRGTLPDAAEQAADSRFSR